MIIIIEIPLRHLADSEASVEIGTTDTWRWCFCLALRLAERNRRKDSSFFRNFGVCFHGVPTHEKICSHFADEEINTTSLGMAQITLQGLGC
jgi:hypothetical protein